MIKATFVREMHEEYGKAGWRLINKPEFDPLNGMAIPHDILEHFKDDDGSVEYELMALGASLFVRSGNQYYLNQGNKNPAGVHIASDFKEHYYHLLEHNLPLELDDPGKFKIPEEIETNIIRAIDSGFDHISEIEGFDEYYTNSNRNKIKGWLVKGYNRAKHRFKKYNSDYMQYIFSEIEKKVNEVSKYAKLGQIMTVLVNLKQCDINVKVDYEYDMANMY